MEKRIFITIFLIIIIVSCSRPVEEGYVSSTSEWIFLYNDDLDIVWKQPNNEGFKISWDSDDYFVARSASKFMGARKSDGKKLWQHSVVFGDLISWGNVPMEKGGERRPNTVRFRFEQDTTFTEYWFAMESGEILKMEVGTLEPRPKPKAAPASASVSVCKPRLDDEIFVQDTKKYVFAMNKDLTIRWKHAIERGIILKKLNPNEAILWGENGVRIYDIFNGELLGKKDTDKKLERVFSTAGNALILRFSDGTEEEMSFQPIK
jgi:hypothetical protein